MPSTSYFASTIQISRVNGLIARIIRVDKLAP